MKKSVYKLTALLMAVLMTTASFTGCASSKASKNSRTDEGKANTTGENGSQGKVIGNGSGDSKWMIGDPDNPIELTVFLNHTWYPIEDFTGIIPEEITKLTGIKLKPVRATDYTQLGVLASSGELPDLIFTSQMMDTLSEPDICYSYNELIDKYNLDWKIPGELITNAKSFSPDDNYYFIMSHTATNKDWQKTKAVPMVATLLYRYDMLEQLGNPQINTLDDLFKVYDMVKDKWPGVTPINFSSETWWLDPFKQWSGCTLQYFIMDGPDDKCRIAAKTDEFKNYLKNCNYMYQKGYFNADNFAWNSAQASADICSGKAFSTVGSTQYGPGSYNSIYDTAPKAELREMKPLSDYPLINTEIGWAATFITKNNKHPEESIRFMQFLFSEEGQKLTQWGREGKEYTLNASGFPEFSKEWKQSIEDNTNSTIYNPWFYFGGSKILEAESRCANEPESFQETNNLIRESYINEPWYAYATPKVNDGDWKVLYDKMVDEVKTGQVKVILSADDAEFDRNYQEFINRLDSIHVDSLAEFMTPRLSEAMKLYADQQ